MASSATELCRVAQAAGWQTLPVEEADSLSGTQVALVEVQKFSQIEDVLALRRRFANALLVGTGGQNVADLDLVIPPNAVADLLPQFLELARAHLHKSQKVSELVRDVAMRRQRMHQLNEISLALTGELTQQELLETILTEGQRIAGCEGCSMFLIEHDELEEPSLVFKLAQNDRVDFPVIETRLPLTAESIAGYVALTGHELNIEDVYRIRADTPYQFNHSFDEKHGYRTQSMLTLPMRDHRERVVGVLQFINRLCPETGMVMAFEEETVELMRAIASQAAVSMQKNQLLEDINQLFESFVQASVKTIEQRDPSTSGHSFRVAQTTVALLEALPLSGSPAYRNLELTQEHIREVRYAALLHDFGKVGVPEAVLVKANKLPEGRLEVIRYRFELQKERLRRQALEHQLDLMHHQPIDHEVARRRVHRQLERKLSLLDQYYQWVVQANDPNVVATGDFAHLAKIREEAFHEFDGSVGGVITDQDVNALSTRRGSLTAEERRAIESHVVFTTEFLSALPWPPELASVPAIAGAHHERMDGSGYPLGLAGEQIPLASRVMAVCDVYDALTAMDRPYKPAMSTDQAFTILYDEADRGLLQKDLIDIFVQNYQREPNAPADRAPPAAAPKCGHHHHKSHAS